MKKSPKFTTKLTMFLIALIGSIAMFTNVSSFGSTASKKFDLTSSFEGTYVLDDIKVNYIYDKTKYEVVNLSPHPYVVIKGDKQLINILKWSGKKPTFTIDLTGKKAGTYREQLTYTGIDKRLQVDLYPEMLDIRIMEQQTLELTPVIQVIGQDKLPEGYAISLPQLQKPTVRIRDIQDRLNQVGQVKGVVDVSNFRQTTPIVIALKVYDRQGKPMKNINLLDKTTLVTIPIENKVKVIEKEVIKKIVETDKNEKATEGTDKSTTKEDKATQDKVTNKIDKQKEMDKNKKENSKTSSDKGKTDATSPLTTEDSSTSKDTNTTKNNNNQNTNNIDKKESDKTNVSSKPSTEQKEPKTYKPVFKNVNQGLEVENLTPDLKWYTKITIDLKDFKEGVYKLPIKTEKGKQTLKIKIYDPNPKKEEVQKDTNNNTNTDEEESTNE